MNKVKLLCIISISLLLLGVFGAKKLLPTAKPIPAEKIHYHAGFVVFDQNKKLDFSDTKFMFLKPCLTNGKEDTNSENIQLEKAHLHDNVGDLVHIEARDAFWQDLFTNIKFPMDYAKTAGYINGEKVSDFQKIPIRPDDSLVVFVGENDEKLLDQKVTREYIETQSKKSVECGD